MVAGGEESPRPPAPAQGATALRLFIHLGNRAATVSFVTPSAEFGVQEPAFRAALETIAFE